MTAFSSVSPGQSLHWPPPCPVSRGNPSVRLESNKNEYFSRHREFILDIFQVRRTFSTPSWRDHHDTWKEQRYKWLPSWKDIPKHLHDPLDSSHLQKLSVSNIYYREAAVTHFIVFTKWSVSGQKRTELSDFCYINSKFPNYHTVVWTRELAELCSGWHYSLSFLVYFKFAKTPLVGLRAYQYFSRGGTHWLAAE